MQHLPAVRNEKFPARHSAALTACAALVIINGVAKCKPIFQVEGNTFPPIFFGYCIAD